MEVCSFIIQAGFILDKAIINKEIAMTDMPPVQFSIFSKSMSDMFIEERQKYRDNCVDALYLELENLIDSCNIPSKQELKRYLKIVIFNGTL